MVITSVKNEKVKELVKLKDKKYRDKEKLFFVEGIDVVMEAIKNNYLKELYILEGCFNPFKEVYVTYVSMDVMKKISDMESVSEYFGVCNYIEERDIGKRILILDDVQDPGNLGTIIRSAVAFNFDTIVLSEKSVSLYNPKVVRSTKGMIFKINIIVRDILEFIDTLDDYLILGTRVNGGENIRDIAILEKVALIVGNEGQGVREEILDKCHKYLYIPMNSECESLNVGVASTILMYEVNNR